MLWAAFFCPLVSSSQNRRTTCTIKWPEAFHVMCDHETWLLCDAYKPSCHWPSICLGDLLKWILHSGYWAGFAWSRVTRQRNGTWFETAARHSFSYNTRPRKTRKKHLLGESETVVMASTPLTPGDPTKATCLHRSSDQHVKVKSHVLMLSLLPSIQCYSLFNNSSRNYCYCNFSFFVVTCTQCQSQIVRPIQRSNKERELPLESARPRLSLPKQIVHCQFTSS